MNDEELKELKQMAFEYGDPIRGKILTLIAYIELLQTEKSNKQ